MALARYADMIAAVNHAMSTRSIAGSASSGGILPGTWHGGSRRVAPAHARGVGVEGLLFAPGGTVRDMKLGPGLTFSWKRALGIDRLKRSISRKTGIPLTRAGRRNKLGRFLGMK